MSFSWYANPRSKKKDELLCGRKYWRRGRGFKGLDLVRVKVKVFRFFGDDDGIDVFLQDQFRREMLFYVPLCATGVGLTLVAVSLDGKHNGGRLVENHRRVVSIFLKVKKVKGSLFNCFSFSSSLVLRYLSKLCGLSILRFLFMHTNSWI